MVSLKIGQHGNSLGLGLPKEVLTTMGVGKGDTVFFTRAPDGGYRITPYDPDFAEQMKLAREIMHERRDAFRALADR